MRCCVSAPSSFHASSQQTHNPSDLGSSHPYINHSLIPLATHYIGSIDFTLLQQWWRGNPSQWSQTGSGKTDHGCVSLDRNGGFSSFRHNNAEGKSMHTLHNRGKILMSYYLFVIYRVKFTFVTNVLLSFKELKQHQKHQHFFSFFFF